MSSDNQPIYCPNEVICELDGEIDSCHVSDDPYSIWFVTDNYSWGSNIKGIYKFNSSNPVPIHLMLSLTKSTLKSNPLIERIGTCRYTIIDSLGNEKDITAFEWPNFFTPLLGPETKWESVIMGDDPIPWPSCVSNDPKLCPLAVIPALVYDNSYSNDVGYFQPINSPIEYQSRFFYSELVSICGESLICTLNIIRQDTKDTHRYILAGSVTVDISTPNEIKIIQLQTDLNSTCILKRKDAFDRIYCDPKTDD